MAESIDSSLRHTLATDMLRGAEDRKGADLRTVQAMMSHKDIKTTLRYYDNRDNLYDKGPTILTYRTKSGYVTPYL